MVTAERSIEDYEAEFLSGFQDHYDDPEAAFAGYKALIVAATARQVPSS